MLLLILLAVRIHEFQVKYEPRTSLFRKVDLTGYSFALVGDSTLCSLHVNNDKDSIWNKFESITKKKCFPGAVSGITNVDFINAARRIAMKMPAYSTVFIDVLPHRFIMNRRSEKGKYDAQFADVLKQEQSVIWNWLYYLKLDYVTELKHILRGKKTDRDGDNYNRVWNIDGNVAREKYEAFIRGFNKGLAPVDDLIVEEVKPFINEISSIFLGAKIKPVFIIMPLNKTEIYSYSDKIQADIIYNTLKEIKVRIEMHLGDRNLLYMDLFEAVPDKCFADLLHTNTCGDEILVKNLADFSIKDY